jgi:hypothetical protein
MTNDNYVGFPSLPGFDGNTDPVLPSCNLVDLNLSPHFQPTLASTFQAFLQAPGISTTVDLRTRFLLVATRHTVARSSTLMAARLDAAEIMVWWEVGPLGRCMGVGVGWRVESQWRLWRATLQMIARRVTRYAVILLGWQLMVAQIS